MGRIHAMREGRDVPWSEVVARAEAARFVLLGEIHDNADHHRLQARLLARLAAESPAPAVVFEMLASDRQADVDAFLASGARDPEALAERVDWKGSGWPAFDLYRPVFAAALEAGLPLYAAGLPQGEPPGGGDSAWRERFALDAPLPAELQTTRIEEMFVSHCELVAREQLGPMVEIQRAR
ncbi:MAG: ChaN family lipoprotein, partial [Myxococcales bacterium]|nr:ChaN family lipoprotein [Myxococcales bacterium]